MAAALTADVLRAVSLPAAPLTVAVRMVGVTPRVAVQRAVDRPTVDRLTVGGRLRDAGHPRAGDRPEAAGR
jgi:hypothetical protein